MLLLLAPAVVTCRRYSPLSASSVRLRGIGAGRCFPAAVLRARFLFDEDSGPSFHGRSGRRSGRMREGARELNGADARGVDEAVHHQEIARRADGLGLYGSMQRPAAEPGTRADASRRKSGGSSSKI